MPDPQDVPKTSRGESVTEYFTRNGVAWGAADLFMVGDGGGADHAVEFLAVLRAIHHRDGGPAFRTIVVMIPPFEKEPAEYLTELKVAFPEAVERARGRPATPEEVDAAFSNISCDKCESLDASSLLAQIRKMAPKSAAIVMHGALYRTTGVEPRHDRLPVPDDVWAPHLHALGQGIEQAVVDADGYAVVDAGVFNPSREANLDILKSLKWGVSGAENPGRSALQIVKQVGHWNKLAAEGRLGTIASEIEAIEGLSPVRKSLIRLQMLSSVGFGLEVRKALETQPELTSGLDAVSALKVAILAEEAEAYAMAGELLTRAAPGIHSQEDVEAALRLAVALRNPQLATAFEATLSRQFPGSHGLRSHRLIGFLRTLNYAAAARLYEGDDSEEARDNLAFFGELSREFPSGVQVGVEAALDRLSRRFPGRRAEAIRASARHLEASGHRREALSLLAKSAEDSGEIDRRSLGLALDMLERGRLVLDPEVDDDLILHAVEWLVHDLARLPRDGYLRLRLANLVSPEILGSTGVPVIVATVLSLFGRPIMPKRTTPVDQRAHPCDHDQLRELFKLGLAFLAEEQPIVMGKRTFPPERLNVPADEAMAGLGTLIDHMARHVVDDGDVQTLEGCVAVGAAIAPLSTEPNDDLLLLRLAASGLAVAGRVQRARDLAEQALSMAGDDAQRRRLAWLAYADVYARLGNHGEALIGLACCAVAGADPTWDQVWYESLLLLRIFRDLGMMSLARPLVEPARRALAEMHAPKEYSARIATVELQLRLFELDTAADPGPGATEALVGDIANNLAQVMDAGDEIEPAATLLANALRMAKQQGVEIPEAATRLLSEATEIASPTSQALIRATGVDPPSVDALLPLVRRMEQARHAEDVGYDVRQLVIAAKRVLGNAVGLTAADAVYATELLADQATSLPASDGRSRLLGVERNGPAAAARAISSRGIPVVMLAQGEAGLVRVVASGGELSGPFIEDEVTFEDKKLDTWGATYPYAYREVDDVNTFYTSTSGIGVAALPERAIVVSNTNLQSFPPNLLSVDGDLAGRTRRLASAPSLAWLKASMDDERKYDGRITAWIPDAAQEGDLSTLGMVTDRLMESFEKHGVTLSAGSAPPAGLAGSEMAIIAAHGGLAEDKRYFRVVTDDVALALASSALSGALTDIEVVVLFVCSGGRLDKHPGASTTIGLVKRLLEEGCRAVVAPPWPMESIVPPYWLPTFLAEWSSGACVLDACFAANEAVRAKLGDDPAKYLAMAVHGNPLVRRAGSDASPPKANTVV